MLDDRGEVVLPGGFTNAGRVTRVGDTVRRPRRPTSPSTWALLDHLERVGFDGAPRFLGLDDRGREMLSYIRARRRSSPTTTGRSPTRRSSASPSSSGATTTRPRRRRRAVGLIDFDLASPASAVWDVTCAARLWAPLREERDAPEGLRGRTLDRLRIFVDAYGLPRRDRSRVVDAAIHTHEQCYRVVRTAVGGGHETFGRMWRQGGQARADRTPRSACPASASRRRRSPTSSGCACSIPPVRCWRPPVPRRPCWWSSTICTGPTSCPCCCCATCCAPTTACGCWCWPRTVTPSPAARRCWSTSWPAWRAAPMSRASSSGRSRSPTSRRSSRTPAVGRFWPC